MIGALIQQYIMKSVIYKPFIIFFLLAVSAGLFENFTIAKTAEAVSAPTVVFVANPTTIRRGESAALSWTSTNADYCVASGGWSEWVFPGGAENVYPKVTTDYGITCSGIGGTAASKVTITVTDAATIPSTTYTPTYTYYNPYQVSGGYYPYNTSPTVNVSIYPTSINRGQAVTVNWTSTNAGSCYAAGGWSGGKNLSGSETFYPRETATYTIVCTNSYGSGSDSESVVVYNSVVGGFGAGCAASRETTAVGSAVTFYGSSSGGSAPVTYRWSGDISGTGESYPVTFSATGRKQATITATDSVGRTASANCSVDIIAVVPSAATAKKPATGVVLAEKTDENDYDKICREKGYVKPAEIELAGTDSGTSTTSDEKDEQSFLSFLAFGAGSLPPGLGLFLFMLFAILLTFGTVMVVLRMARKREATP